MKISIITVCFNAVGVIEKTILSVISQTYNDVEYIIIDGGSTDGTLDIVKKYENYIAYWFCEPDSGIYNAMNKGVKYATGLYCNFMNAGDFFINEKVLENIFTSNRNEDLISGIAQIPQGFWYPPEEKNISLFYFFKKGFCHQATFIKRQLMEEYPYDEDLKISADLLFFIMVSVFRNGTSYTRINEIVCFYDTNGISSNMEKADEERCRILKSVVPARIFKDYQLLYLYDTPLLKMLLPIINNSFFVKSLSFLRFLKKKIKKNIEWK